MTARIADESPLRRHSPNRPYAWLRLAASLALMTISGVGMYAVRGAARVQAEFGVARGELRCPTRRR
jgi:hypothetical protein